MTKLQLFLLQMLGALSLRAAVFADDNFSIASMCALVVVAGAFASTISRRGMRLVIGWVNAALALALTVGAATSSGWAAAVACLAATTLLTSAAWLHQKRGRDVEPARKYDSHPTNPWNAIDQGIDPTE